MRRQVVSIAMVLTVLLTGCVNTAKPPVTMTGSYTMQAIVAEGK